VAQIIKGCDGVTTREEPDSGVPTGAEADARLDALMAAADDQMLSAIRGSLNLDVGLTDILNHASASQPALQRVTTVAKARPARRTLSLRMLLKWLKPRKRRTPPHQAAAFIEMRLTARSLGEYLVDYLDRVNSLDADIARAAKQAETLSRRVGTASQVIPCVYAERARTLEANLGQIITDASSLATDLEDPCAWASKLTSIARASRARELFRDSAILAEILAACVRHATAIYVNLHRARAAAADKGWRGTQPSWEPVDLAGGIITSCSAARAKHGDLARDLAAANGCNPRRHLASIEIDASGVDLSDAHLPDVDLLDGVIWTPETTWPVTMENQVRAHSRQIRESVYQVHSGGRSRSKAIDV
jgi:hypothetical protein